MIKQTKQNRSQEIKEVSECFFELFCLFSSRYSSSETTVLQYVGLTEFNRSIYRRF